MLGLGLTLTPGNPILSRSWYIDPPAPSNVVISSTANGANDWGTDAVTLAAWVDSPATAPTAGFIFGFDEGIVCASFSGLTIAPFAKIVSATITLTRGVGTTADAYTISGQKIANAASPDSPLATTWTTTTATTVIAAGETGSSVKVHDVTSIVQEIVDYTSWASGNRMNFMYRQNTNRLVNQTTFADTEPVLAITYRATTPAERESLALAGSRLIHFLPFTDYDLGQLNFLRSRVLTNQVTAPVPNGGNALRATGDIPNHCITITAGTTELADDSEPYRSLFGPDDGGVTRGVIATLSNRSYLLMCARRHNASANTLGHIIDVISNVEMAIEVTDCVTPPIVAGAHVPNYSTGKAIARVRGIDADTDSGLNGAAGPQVNSTQTSRNVANENHRMGVYYSHQTRKISLLYDNGAGTVERVDGAATNIVSDSTLAASGFSLAAGYSYYGMAMFEFSSEPSDLVDAFTWMTAQWALGNKAIYPAWR